MAQGQDTEILDIEEWKAEHSDDEREEWQMSQAELDESRENLEAAFEDIHHRMEEENPDEDDLNFRKVGTDEDGYDLYERKTDDR